MISSALDLNAESSTKAASAWLIYAILIMCAWNAVLRPSVDIPITPYYLLFPVIFLWLLVASYEFRKWQFWFAIACIYGLAIGMIYGVPAAMMLAQLMKYLQLLTLFGMLAWLYQHDPEATQRLKRLIALLVAMVFIIGAAKELTGFEFSTVVHRESAIWVSTYFFSPNDLALFLAGAACLLMVSRVRLFWKILSIVLILAINLRNDAKAALLAVAIMIMAALLLSLAARFKVKPIYALSLPVLLLLPAMGVLSTIVIEIGDVSIDFRQLFFDSLGRVFQLEPYHLGGSIYDRTDALIYAIQEMASSLFLGLGPAGSVYMLSLPDFQLMSAKSLHNAVVELVVELGPVMLIIVGWLLKPVFFSLNKTQLNSREYGRILLCAAAPLLSVSQSSGYISNYAFWLVAYVIWNNDVSSLGANQSIQSDAMTGDRIA